MTSAISLLVSLYYFLGGLRAARNLPVIFLFFLPLLPRIIGLGIGDEGFALTARRLLYLVTLICAFAMTPVATHFFRMTVKQFKFLFLPLFAYIVLTQVTPFTVGDYFYSLASGIEAAIEILAVIFLANMLTRNHEPLVVFARYAFVYPLVVIFPIVLVEYFLKEPILSFFLGAEASSIEGAARSLDGRFRDDGYRAQAFFNGPIQLAEYSAYALPFVFFLRLQKHLKILPFVTIVAILFTMVIMSGSRGGLMFLLLGCVLLPTLNIRQLKLFGWVAVILFGIAAALIIINQLQSFELVKYSSIESQSDRSTYARLYQFFYYIPIVMDNPFFGHGFIRNIPDRFGESYDIFLIGLVIESGVVGFILFFSPVILVSATILGKIKGSDFRDSHRRFGITVLVFLIFFIIGKFIYSVPENNVYFIFVAALILGGADHSLQLKSRTRTR